MSTVSGHYTYLIAEKIKELSEHPNWEGEESNIELKKGSYAIIKETYNDCFRLLWLNKKGEKVSVSFWIDTATFQWCFRNGQAHTFSQLDKLILDIFKHFKEKDTK